MIRVRCWLVLVLYCGIVPCFCFRVMRVVLAGPSVNVDRELRSVSKPLGRLCGGTFADACRCTRGQRVKLEVQQDSDKRNPRKAFRGDVSASAIVSVETSKLRVCLYVLIVLHA